MQILMKEGLKMKVKKLLAAFTVCFALFCSFAAISAFAADEEITFTNKSNETTTYQKFTDSDGNITLYFKSEDTSVNYATAAYVMDGKTVTFRGSTLRSVNNLMRAYWEASKNTTGCDYNAERLPADNTGDLTWTVYGAVEQGEYTGGGALTLPKLDGGYIYHDKTYTWKTITVNAGNAGAVIVSNETFDYSHSYISNAVDSTAFNGVTLDEGIYVMPSSAITFNNCTFTGQLRVPSGNGTFTVKNCNFTGEKNTKKDTNGYMFHYQASGALNFTGNTVAADKYYRGLNIDNKELTATVSDNTIGSVTDTGRSLIQISSVIKLDIINNTLNLDGDNAFTLHTVLLNCTNKPEINIKANKINGSGYLIYDDAAANSKSFTADNLTLNIDSANVISENIDKTKGSKGDKTYILDENGYVFKSCTQTTPEILEKSLYVTYSELGKFDFGSGEADSIKLTLFAGVDTLDYSSVGFDVTVGEKTQSFPITTVYTSVKTMLDGKETTVKAAEFGSGVNYIFGQTINFPATTEFADASANWTPFAMKNGKKITVKTFNLADIFPGTLN